MSVGSLTSSSGSSLQSVEQQISVLEKQINAARDAKTRAADEASLAQLEREAESDSAQSSGCASTASGGGRRLSVMA